jgi:hypothetical protein
MTEAGERLGCVRIDNDPLVLAAEMAKAGEHPEVVLGQRTAGTGPSTCCRRSARRCTWRIHSG